MEKDKKEDENFDVNKTIMLTEKVLEKYNQIKDIVFDDFFAILEEFCKAFKKINTFLGIAFSDVKDKVRVFKQNNQRFQGHKGFFSFVKMEMELNIVMYNTGNNKELKAPKQYKTYDSTGRNLLRMMWLLTFIRTTFEGLRDQKANMSNILCKAYDDAFGDNHSFIVRNGAKLAIKATSDRKEFVEVISGRKYDADYFAEINEKFMKSFVPIHEIMWNFYKENNLTKLP